MKFEKTFIVLTLLFSLSACAQTKHRAPFVRNAVGIETAAIERLEQYEWQGTLA